MNMEKNNRPEVVMALALAAAEDDDNERAIVRLTTLAEEEPQSAWVIYLLGAALAQGGRFDEAAQAMQHTLLLDPQLHLARFQYGLLLMSSHKPEEALVNWAPLDVLGEQHQLNLFRRGLTHLARDEFQAAQDCLVRGIAASNEHPLLNRDMERLLPKIAGAQVASTATASHIGLAGYLEH